MANNFLTDQIIVKEALRLLKNNTVFGRLVYRDYERRFGKVGDTISLELPFRVKSAEGPTYVEQPMVDRKIPLKINRHRHVGLKFTERDRRLSIENFSSRYLKSAIVQIANEVDRSIALQAKNAWYSSGVPGVTPGNFLAFANAGAYQTLLGVPDDSMRRAVCNPETMAVLADQLKDLDNDKGLDRIVPKGYKGDTYGYSMHESQNLYTHLVGDYGASTPLIVNTGGNTLADGTSELYIDGIIDGATSTTVLRQGDVITLEGVYSVNPQNYESTGRLMQFVVQEDVISDNNAATVHTVTVSPALNAGTATTTNGSGQTVSLKAYQNITNLPANNAQIRVMGATNTSYKQDFLFHKEAIALAMLEFELPETAVKKASVSDPDTGFAFTMTGAYDIINHQEIYRIDALWGTSLIYGDLALRLWGASPEAF